MTTAAGRPASRRSGRRAVAIVAHVAHVAHVDHGKTTLVDALFRPAGFFRAGRLAPERAMGSGEFERKRDATFLAKSTSIPCRGVVINIVDTPGHRDFGSEVERILTLVDGLLLQVGAARLRLDRPRRDQGGPAAAPRRDPRPRRPRSALRHHRGRADSLHGVP